ncbi:unnamed protein product, partial [Discosporangium mesarthrocarpum]
MLQVSQDRLTFHGSKSVVVHNPRTAEVDISLLVIPKGSAFSVSPQALTVPGGGARDVVIKYDGAATDAGGSAATLIVRSGNDEVSMKIEVEHARAGDGHGRMEEQMSAAEARVLRQENANLQSLVSELRAATPNIARLADITTRREREGFEDKTRRALALMRRKDEKIRELSEALH